jgi:hypothetical protein
MASTPRPPATVRVARRLVVAVAALALAAALGFGPWVATVEAQGAAQAVPVAQPVPLDEGSRPVRVRVPYFGIDLPVVWSERQVAGNPAGYPLCDVAQYLISREQGLVLPGQPGTSWIYGHAQPGMFLPLTESYFTSGRAELMGKLIKLQLRDGRLLTYRISEVRVAHDYEIAERPNDEQQRLVLQTSTGSTGASPRLMVAGRLIEAEWTDEPPPVAQPRACWQPPPAATPRARQNARTTRTAKSDKSDTPAPTAAPVVEAGDQLDPVTMLVGSGAVLLGATVVAVYIVRRP